MAIRQSLGFAPVAKSTPAQVAASQTRAEARGDIYLRGSVRIEAENATHWQKLVGHYGSRVAALNGLLKRDKETESPLADGVLSICGGITESEVRDALRKAFGQSSDSSGVNRAQGVNDLAYWHRRLVSINRLDIYGAEYERHGDITRGYFPKDS